MKTRFSLLLLLGALLWFWQYSGGGEAIPKVRATPIKAAVPESSQPSVPLEPGECTANLLPWGKLEDLSQLEIAFTLVDGEGEPHPLKLESIQLYCEASRWASYYHVEAEAMRLGVGRKQELRSLVAGQTYTVFRAGYAPSPFTVPDVKKGECARIEVALEQEG